MDFPLFEFPSFSRPANDETGTRRVQFNSVEWGRLSAMVEHDSSLKCRQEGRGKYVLYESPPLPLSPPNTRTPYDDHERETHVPKPGLKHCMYENILYLLDNYRAEYFPIPQMYDELQDDLSRQDMHSPNFGTTLVFAPYKDNANPGILGLLCFATGPNLSTVGLGILTENDCLSGSFYGDSFNDWTDACNPLHLLPLEAYQMPGRINQLDSTHVCGQDYMTVSTDYHVSIFQILCSSNSKPSLQCIRVQRADSRIGSVSLSPYIPGEIVMVTEKGGVFLCEAKSNVKILRPSQSTSYPRQCVYGSHPRSIILLEDLKVFMFDCRSAGAPTIIQILIAHEVTCISHDTKQTFRLLVCTLQDLLLVDTRLPESVLLAVRHNIPTPPRLLSTVHTHKGNTLVLVASSDRHDSIMVYCYDGSSCSYFNILPHSVIALSQLISDLKLTDSSAPITSQVGYRFEQSTSGITILAMPNRKFAAIKMSILGDMFYQYWRYSGKVGHGIFNGMPPVHRDGYNLWIKEATAQEQQLTRFRDMESERNLDLFPIMTYILSTEKSPPICIQCHFATNKYFPSVNTQSSWTRYEGKCRFCLQLLNKPLHKEQESDYCQSVAPKGLTLLKQSCNFKNPETDLEMSLVRGWEDSMKAQLFAKESEDGHRKNSIEPEQDLIEPLQKYSVTGTPAKSIPKTLRKMGF